LEKGKKENTLGQKYWGENGWARKMRKGRKMCSVKGGGRLEGGKEKRGPKIAVIDGEKFLSR